MRFVGFNLKFSVEMEKAKQGVKRKEKTEKTEGKIRWEKEKKNNRKREA